MEDKGFTISANQQRYLFAEIATGGSYSLPVSFLVKNKLDVKRLKKCI